MKVTGRKPSVAYELYGFIPKVENGKHSAICMTCNRVLQNTAAVRLQKHRSTCHATRTGNGVPVNFPSFEIKRRSRQKAIQVKTTENDIGLEDGNITSATNDHLTYQDTAQATNTSRTTHKIRLHGEMYNIFNVPSELKEGYGNADQKDENFIKSTALQHQPSTEPFESYYTTNTSAVDTPTDNEIHEISDEDIIDDEPNILQNNIPYNRTSKPIQDELSKAETEYYRCKAAYFTKLTENCKIKRTLMLLESRKLQLEIKKLTDES